MPAFDETSLNALNRVAAAYVAGISDVEHYARAGLVNAIPAMEVRGAGAILYTDDPTDFSTIGTNYTGTGAPSRGWAPNGRTEVELPIGENRDHIDMPWRQLYHAVSSMSGGRVNESVLNYGDELASRVGLLKLAKLHRQERRVDAALVAASGGALGTAIDDSADAVAVLDAAFQTSRGDTLILREDGLTAFLRNAKVREAMGASNALQSVSPSSFGVWLNDTFGWYAPWASANGGIKVVIDSLKDSTDDTGSYVMSNLMVVARTLGPSGERPTRQDPATISGRTRLSFGIVQTYMRPGETMESAPQDGTLLSAVSARMNEGQRAENYSLFYRAARKEDEAVYRHYLDDAQGVKVIDTKRLYVRSGVVT